MGSLSLMCPMCCGETFNNSESLKYHLLSMTDNLYCPGCSLRTYSVASLIQHLDHCGKDYSQMGMPKEPELPSHQMETNDTHSASQDILINDVTDDAINDSFLATVNEDGIMIVGEGRTIQVDENGDIQVVEKITLKTNDEIHESTNTPIIIESNTLVTEDSKASVTEQLQDSVTPAENVSNTPEPASEFDLKNNNTSTVIAENGDFDVFSGLTIKIEENQNKDKESKDVTTSAESENTEAVYSCSTCGVSFTSVVDHIKEYHDGQEVVLEMADQQMNEVTESIKEQVSVENFTINKTEEKKRPGRPKASTKKQKQSLNTLKTEECIDSDGRKYTRKVVQLERFWDRTPITLSSTKAPMIEKFFSNVEGVKVKDKSITVAPTQMYRCNQCLEQFANLNEFKIHMCLQGKNQCEQCDQTFSTVKALHAHLKIHDYGDSAEKAFKCNICRTEFGTHKSLRLHSRMHAPVKTRHIDAPEGTEEETFKCVICGTTLSESYRAAHMSLHEGNEVTCTICNRKFDSAESLSMHAAVHVETNAHNSANDITQAVQNAMDPIYSNGSLGSTALVSGPTVAAAVEAAALAEEAEAQKEKPYQCQHCGRRFTRPHEKVKHERIHTGEKPHSCEVCGKKFRVSYCLTLHMRTHTGVRPYECQHCGKRFKASSVYNHHLLTHGDERAYTCPYCPKTFKTRVQLAGHKNSHTKPFRCTECSRPFASLYAARAHMQTHKKDNNLKFSCHICGASYGRAFALKDHLKHEHEQDQDETPPKPVREEEVHEVENFMFSGVDDEQELIVPHPLTECSVMETDLVGEE